MVKFDDGLFDEAEKLVQRFATPSGTGSTQGTTAGMIGFLGTLSLCLYPSSCSGNGAWTWFPLRRAKSTTG